MPKRKVNIETDPKPKIRKRRKPMSPEQKAAASERLALARAKRQSANPPAYTNIHPSVVDLPDEHMFSRKNVQSWIKYQKEMLSEYRKAVRMNVKGAIASEANTHAYIRHMEWYLKHGDWCDNYYGKEGTSLIKWSHQD